MCGGCRALPADLKVGTTNARRRSCAARVVRCRRSCAADGRALLTVVVLTFRSALLLAVVVLTFRSALIARREAVSDPRLAQEISRIGRVGLDLLAQLRHERPQVLRLFDGIRPPDGLENRAVGENSIAIVCKQGQQLKLFRREAD